jgi:4,5-dihydroxyphthalate decarboxylase
MEHTGHSASSSRRRLTMSLGSYKHVASLLDGSVQPEGFEVDAGGSRVDASNVMCRELAFDICDISVTGYLLAKRYSKGITAIPVFPIRSFGQSHSVVVNERSDVLTPKDLEGKKFGARAYTGVASLWSRGVLQHEYGVDADKVTWVSNDEEHVLEYQQDAPPNAIYDIGTDLVKRLVEGDLAAGVNISTPGASHIKPLIPDSFSAAVDFYRRTGIYQINHVMVLKDSLIKEYPALAGSLYAAFVEAKRRWLESGPELPIVRELDLPDGDPFPYGIEANRPSLEALLQYSYEQHILIRSHSIEELFALP